MRLLFFLMDYGFIYYSKIIEIIYDCSIYVLSAMAIIEIIIEIIYDYSKIVIIEEGYLYIKKMNRTSVFLSSPSSLNSSLKPIKLASNN